MRPKSVLAYRRKSFLYRVRDNGPKNQRVATSGHKTRVQGGALVFFPPTFFKESRAPPPESAGNPRCRVYPALVLTGPLTDDRDPPPGGGRYNRLHFPRQKYRISTATVTAQETG